MVNEIDKVRGFEVVSAFADQEVKIPQRATAQSAGYDIYPLKEIIIPAYGQAMIETGLKAYMLPDEWLDITIRSSYGIKKGLRIVNVHPVVDADYYNNQKNEGHICIFLKNESHSLAVLSPDEACAQGIFMKYLTTDDDRPVSPVRNGGFGSTSVRPFELEKAKQMLNRFYGLHPYDGDNPSKGDPYFAQAIEKEFGMSLTEIEDAIKRY